MPQVTFNPFTDNLDFIGGGAATLTIPEYSADPGSPVVNQAWVLKTGGGGAGAGIPIGLLLSLTYAGSGSPATYQLSYYTAEGTIVRTTLS